MALLVGCELGEDTWVGPRRLQLAAGVVHRGISETPTGSERHVDGHGDETETHGERTRDKEGATEQHAGARQQETWRETRHSVSSDGRNLKFVRGLENLECA